MAVKAGTPHRVKLLARQGKAREEEGDEQLLGWAHPSLSLHPVWNIKFQPIKRSSLYPHLGTLYLPPRVDLLATALTCQNAKYLCLTYMLVNHIFSKRCSTPCSSAYLTWLKRSRPTAGLPTISRSVHGPTRAFDPCTPSTTCQAGHLLSILLNARAMRKQSFISWVGASYRVVSCRCLREDPYWWMPSRHTDDRGKV